MFMSVTPVHAAETTQTQAVESILLSPTSKRYELSAGETRRGSFDILNDGESAYEFTVYARPYSVKNELYEPDFVANAKNADAYKWVQFDQPSYTIQPGKKVKVEYTLRVPENAAPGGHYGVLFAETQPKNDQSGTAIIRKKRVGSIIYANVKGDITSSGAFNGFDAPFFQFKAPLTVRQSVTNKGNIDFEAASNVRVYDVFNQLKYTQDKKAVILPETTRTVVNDWQNPAWIGLYKVDQKISFLDTSRNSSTYVLLVPLWVYIALLLTIGGRVLYAVSRRKRKK
jgi:hypothetical protein